MSYQKAILALLFFFPVFAFQTNGQNPKPVNEPVKRLKLNDFIEGKTVIAEVKFVGLDADYGNYSEAIEKPLYETEAIKNIREERAFVFNEAKFRYESVEKTIKILKQWLASEGYLKAEVLALGEKLPKNRMRLIFSIDRGEIVRVSEIRFTGNENISSEELIADFEQCLGGRREIFERRLYDYCSQKNSRELMFSRGYLQARVLGVTPRFNADSYIVTIQVYEGVRHRYGEIKITGAKIFTEKEILEMFGQNLGDVGDGKAIRKFFFEKLKKTYFDRGFLSYDADFDPEFIAPQVEGLDGIVNISATIYEGPAFKIANIIFPGLDESKKQQLKRNFTLKESEIFSQSKFEEDVKKINETEEFFPIGLDSAYIEIKTDEETATVDLLIHLQKIPK